ncbi:hypothetical protein [Brevundimonas sp.]|uniref:hypothetical protein n=1 Tax=Brevundimonas sp. TaxID=1871086 RepID=UPI0028ACD7AE|nr:hypothetical protein [Brevundimonas sp.]
MRNKTKPRSRIFKRIAAEPAIGSGYSDKNDFSAKIFESKRLIDRIERDALQALDKLGLPCQSGKYFRRLGGGWQHKDAVPKSIFDQWCVEGGWEMKLLPQLIKSEFADTNSEAGFLVAVLEGVGVARSAITRIEKQPNVEAAIAFAAGANLVAEWLFWREEFLLGRWIAPTRLQIPGRKVGGANRAASQRPIIEAKWAQWQSCADKIWDRNPELSKSAVASLVARQVNCGTKPDTISRRIKKSGGC